ncbi:MAG: spore coat associated protein CotJA [Ruminococcaceae bacterium]|nr:spore coat associated protein CotJA [Oscillospiraceae bacterium]
MYNDNKTTPSREGSVCPLQQRAFEELTRHTGCRREQRQSHECECEREGSTWGLHGYPLASVFSPIQEWQEIYELETGFQRGTIFKELDLPFLCGEKKGGCGCVK